MASGLKRAGSPCSASMRRLVGQHRLARHVADRQDVRIGGSLLLVGVDEAALVDFDLRVFQPEPVTIGPPADADQHAAEPLGPLGAAIGRLEFDLDRVSFVGQRDHFSLEIDGGKVFRQPGVQRLDQIAVGPRQQAVGQLDDAHLRAQFGIDGPHLQPDVSAADDQQRLRDVGQLQCPGGIHDPRGWQVERRNLGRPRAGRQDAMLEREPIGLARRVEPVEPQRGRVFEVSAGLDHLHIAALDQLLQPAGQRVDHFVLAGPQFLDVEPGRIELHAPLGHLAGLAHYLGHVQQGLRGDAAPQQADTPQPRLGLDERVVHPQIGRQKRGRITARAAAEHD